MMAPGRLQSDYSETSWIDSNIDYGRADLYVVRYDGKKDNLLYFINDSVNKRGEVNKSLTDEQRAMVARFLKSYLAKSDGDGVRPLLNNRYGFELLKDTTFLRSGIIKDANLSVTLKYRGVEVREINVSKGTIKKLNEGSEEEKQFTALINEIFNRNGKVIKEISKKTGVDPVSVQGIINNDDTIADSVDTNYVNAEKISKETGVSPELVKEIVKEDINGSNAKEISKKTGVQPKLVKKTIERDTNYVNVEKISKETGVSPELVKEIMKKNINGVGVEEIFEETGVPTKLIREVIKERLSFTQHTDEIIKKIQDAKREHVRLKEPKEPDLGGKRLRLLRKQLEKIPDDLRDGKYSPLVLPKVVEDGIIDNSVSEIHNSLHSHAKKIEELTLTEQELRGFTGILSPKGDADTKIEALDVLADEYRLKALREAEPRKEQLYKNIQETAELKADLITIVEKGEAPKNNEAISVFKEEIKSNESVNDISRLEKFKKWIKENWLGSSALIITVASLLTTVIVTARHAISKGAKAVKSFSQSVYRVLRNIAKSLGPILGPVVSAIGSLLSVLLKYAAEGIAWLAKNLWALVIAIVYLIYSRYQRKKK